MKFLSCPGCAAKDGVISRLDKRVEDLEQTLLALVDARAYALRYPREKAARPAAARAAAQEALPFPYGVATPAQVRAQVYEAPLSQEQIEAEFEEIR